MAQIIVDGLRSQPGHFIRSGLPDPGNDGDVEEDCVPRTRKGGGPKHCNKWENLLSVSFCSLILSTQFV